MTANTQSKVTISILECHGEGIQLSTVLDGFKKLKSELEALNCEVDMKVYGWPIESISFEELPESETAQ